MNQEAASHVERALADQQKAHLPGGAAWEKQNADWKAAALADPDLGNGKPEALDGNVTLAKRVLATFFPAETVAFLEQTGLGSHPATLKGLVKIGKAMREDDFIVPSGGQPGAKKSDAELFYGDSKGRSA